jgi:hypothetical protein
MLNKFYTAVGSILLLSYSVLSFNGWELFDPARGRLSEAERTSKSYRTTRSWFFYSGFRGGK